MASFPLRSFAFFLRTAALLFVSTCGPASSSSDQIVLSLSASNVEVSPGQTIDVAVTLHENSALDGPIMMSLRSSGNQPLPDGLNAAFDPPTLSLSPGMDASTTLHLLAQMPLAGSSYQLVVDASAQGEQASIPLHLTMLGNGANWHRSLRSSGTNQALALIGDASGGAYLSLNTTTGFAGYKNQGSFDSYVLHYRADGALDFVVSLSTPGSDVLTALGTDANGNVYAAGFTYGAFPGQTSTGSADAFLAKLSSTGSVVWLKQFGTDAVDQLTSVAVAPDGTIYAGGLTEGAFAGKTNAGGFDVFVARFSPDGTLAAVSEFGTNQDERTSGVTNESGVGLAVDAGGSLYVCGSTQGAFPGQTSQGLGDAFVARLNPDGTQAFLKQFGSFSDDALLAIATHPNGQAYAVGWSRGPLPGQVQSGGQDVIVVAFQGDGTMALTQQFGTSYPDAGSAISVYNDGIYIIGSTRGSLPGQMQFGVQDFFFTRMSPDGKTVWMHQLGTPQSDSGTAILAGPAGIYVSGTTFGDFDDPNVNLTENNSFLFQFPLN